MSSPESLERAREWWDAHWSEHRDVGISLLAVLLDTVRAEERAEMERVMAQEVGDLVREGARGLMARADEAERAVLDLWGYAERSVRERLDPLVARIRERAEVPK